MIEKNKESQAQSLAELQQELKSLKALLLSRGSGFSGTPASPLPTLGRPAIPAWQLASPLKVNGVESSSTSPGTISSSVSVSNGKGKESEGLESSVES